MQMEDQVSAGPHTRKMHHGRRKVAVVLRISGWENDVGECGAQGDHGDKLKRRFEKVT